jgi:type VI secretion system protein ImpK
MRLSDCFIELIAYTALVIRPDGGGQAAFEQVEADIRRLIADSEAKCQQGGFHLRTMIWRVLPYLHG